MNHSGRRVTPACWERCAARPPFWLGVVVPGRFLFCYPGSMGETSQMGAGGPAETLLALKEAIRDCRGCGLCEGRTQVVFGVGNPEADLMFVGEGPGFHEDRQGEPFVGAAGKLLTELLGQIGLRREDVYIANVVKCRPPENRDPLPDEIAACRPHLMEQIAIIRPRVICTLGRFATKLLADTELSITAIHGKAKEREIAGVDVIIFPVFHPAAALYTPANRKVLEQDFAKLRHVLLHGLASSPEGRGQEHCAESAGDEERGEGGSGAEGLAATGGADTRPGAAKAQGSTSNRQEQLPLW